MRGKMRGASNAKAERELGLTLRYPSWRQGFFAAYKQSAEDVRPDRLACHQAEGEDGRVGILQVDDATEHDRVRGECAVAALEGLQGVRDRRASAPCPTAMPGEVTPFGTRSHAIPTPRPNQAGTCCFVEWSVRGSNPWASDLQIPGFEARLVRPECVQQLRSRRVAGTRPLRRRSRPDRGVRGQLGDYGCRPVGRRRRLGAGQREPDDRCLRPSLIVGVEAGSKETHVSFGLLAAKSRSSSRGLNGRLSCNFWRSVFERYAPNSIAKIETLIAPHPGLKPVTRSRGQVATSSSSYSAYTTLRLAMTQRRESPSPKRVPASGRTGSSALLSALRPRAPIAPPTASVSASTIAARSVCQTCGVR
jgi:hypothetical protein